MTTAFDMLEAEALKLSNAERAQLAEHLIASLDEDDEIEAAWADEITRRVAEIKCGAVTGIPLDEAIARARAMLARIDAMQHPF